MTEQIEISVVMSVYNGAHHLRESVDSILSQQGVSLELIVVDDGSTDESGRILGEYADRDSRVRVVHQENQGLTRALIMACAASRGKYIARQDAGDLSLPDRMIRQLKCIVKNPDSSFVSCGTRFVGPKGEHLYDVNQDPDDATDRLLTLKLGEIRGPSSHPSTVFSRAFYERVGGYRSAFYFAQDLDLWVRLAEHGRHIVMPEVLYQASVTVDSVSGLYRREQIQTTRLMLRSTKLRREGITEDRVLKKVARIRPRSKRRTNRRTRARALYFIGACLKRRNDPKGTAYFKEALRANPFHLRSAIHLLLL